MGSFWKAFRRLLGIQIDHFWHRFLTSIWSFFIRFWSHYGRPWGIQICHFWHRFLKEFGMSFQERPKSSQERPKSGPRAAKGGTRAAQERPKSGPGAAQERPRAAKNGPRAAKSGSCSRARCRTKDITSRRHRPSGLYNKLLMIIRHPELGSW